MTEGTAVVRRNDASSQIVELSTGPGHTCIFNEAEIFVRDDSRELPESWFSINSAAKFAWAWMAQTSAASSDSIGEPGINTWDEIVTIDASDVGEHQSRLPAVNAGCCCMEIAPCICYAPCVPSAIICDCF
uniref:Uncharacterized protein n=1 Tax=Schistocephalus solidus TaxID=70667 RepID=A0A0V0JBN3_SCHSO